MRRSATEGLLHVRRITYARETVRLRPTTNTYPATELSYRGNVANSQAAAFYRAHGVERIAPAFELQPVADAPLMFTKFCLRYELGGCPRCADHSFPYAQPLTLQSPDGRNFALRFDCKACVMEVGGR
jgi:putative protease